MLSRGYWLGVALGLAFISSDAASAACVSISSESDLHGIKSDMTGDYCLTRDLELTDQFVPIGSLADAFSGSFDGRGHTIRGLTIRSERSSVGLFAWVHGGSVSNLTLAAVSVNSTRKFALVGGVAGFLTGGGELINVHVTGKLKCSGDGCRIGAIVGEIGDGTMRRSSATASITGGNGGAAGGAAGQINGTAVLSFATGRVICGRNCAAGGFVGDTVETTDISQSFATGPVEQSRDGIAGGFVGRHRGKLRQSYSTGPVRIGASTAAAFSGSHGGRLGQAFGAGRVTGDAGSFRAGLSAQLGAGADTATAAYWDTVTTRQNSSVVGVGRTTNQLQASLPAGFGDAWRITKGYSYPFLDLPGLDFASTLATVVKADALFTFLPISQNEPMEYAHKVKHADQAARAAVFTMIARGIGVTRRDDRLDGVAIDRYFWDDLAQASAWTGPVTAYANLLARIDLPDATPINNANILGALKRGDLVIVICGHVTAGQDTPGRPHWMLATLFRTNPANIATHIVANDPWTGKQVLIDITSKRVTSPANFPLKDFKVEAYRVVKLN